MIILRMIIVTKIEVDEGKGYRGMTVRSLL